LNATAEKLDQPQLAPVQQTLFGRFMLPDTSEHACKVSDISAAGATFHSDHVPMRGLPLVAYLEELGRVEVLADDPVEGGFKITFNVKGARLEKLESRIKWLNHRHVGAAEGRRHARFEPRDNKSQITLPDGRVYNCEVLDISLSGAGIRVEVMPSIGTYVMLGKMRGRVVRYLEHGVAIEFVKHLDQAQLGTI
jgi:hypothetical protein